MTGRRITPAEAFSASAAVVKRALRLALAKHEVCQDALGESVGVTQQYVSRWLSSKRDDTIPVGRLNLAPREVVLAFAREWLSEHHAVVVDLLAFGADAYDPGEHAFSQIRAAQQASAHVSAMMLEAVEDMQITSSEANQILAAVEEEQRVLEGIAIRMRRIKANGVEGVGPARGH